MKFLPQGIRGERQTVTYNTVKDQIVQYVQKTYKNGQDIAVSLRDLQAKDLSPYAPVRGTSIETATNANTKEQTGMDIRYQAKLERFLDREQVLEANLSIAYALIYSTYCNKTMQYQIEEHPDFETKIRDDPIELLPNIKVLMHDPIRAKYPFTSLTKAMTRILNIRQRENEGLLEYIKQFKESRDIMKTHIGTDILDKFVKNTKDYQDENDATLKKEMKDKAFAKWMAYLLI